MARNWVIVLVASIVLAASAAAGQELRYPTKLIRIIAPYPPGGPTDVAARILANEFEKRFGQTVIVENRAGASGTIGANAVAKAEPDGHTLLLTIGSYSATAAIMRQIPFDPVKDLTGVSLMFSVPNILLVPPRSTINSISDLVTRAKDAPGKLTYATAGYGTTTHLIAVILEQAAGISLQHIPYKGGAAAIEASMTNTVDMTFTVTNTALPLVKSGLIRAIAIGADRRSELLPDVPTFAEAGYEAVVSDSWIGLLAPSGTPKSILDRLQKVIVELLDRPDTRERLLAQGLVPRGTTPDEFQAQISAEIETYREVAQKVNLLMDQ